MRSELFAPRGRRVRRSAAVGVVAAVVASFLVAVPARAEEPVALPAVVLPADLQLSGDVQVGQTLRVTGGDVQPVDATVSVVWTVDGVEVLDPVEAEDPLDLTLLPEHLDALIGAEIRATAPDHEEATASLSAGPVAAGVWSVDPPTLTGPVVRGSAVEVSGPDLPSDASVSWQWIVNGEEVPGATGRSFVPKIVGSDVWVRMTVTRDGYETLVVPSESAEVGATPLPDGVPAILGDVRVGRPLTAQVGEWAAGATTTARWSVAGVVVADGETFVPGPTHVGGELVLTVSATADGHLPAERSTAPRTVAAGIFGSAPTPSFSTPRVGTAISVTTGTWSPSASFSYVWRVAGAVVSRNASFTPQAAHLGKPVTVTVTGTALGGYQAERASKAVAVQPRLFSRAPVPTIKGTVRVGSVLTPVPGAWSPSASLEYFWRVDDVVVSTKSTFTPSASHRGKRLVLSVRASAPGGYQQVVRSAPVTIASRPFTRTVAPTLSGKVRVGGKVTAVPGTWSPVATSRSYVWKIDGRQVGTGASFVPSADHRGKKLTVSVTGTRTDGYGATRTSAAVTVGAGVFATVPTPRVQGTVRVGSKLTAVSGTFTPAATAVAYSWRVDGVHVAGGPTFTPTAAQRGKKLTLTVTGARTGGYQASRTTPAVVIGARPFTTSTKPKISGAVTVGTTLTAVTGNWSPAPTFKYSWKLDGAQVGTARTFTPAGAHRGKKLTLTVTASASGGYVSVLTTAPVTVWYGTFRTSPTPTISGTPQVGKDLRAVVGSWSPTAALSYQWFRSGFAISGATNPAYRLVAADQGKTISVRVTANRTGYLTTTRTSARTGAVAPAPVPSRIGPGTHVVGVTIKPGTYYTWATFGCYWERRSTAGTSLSGIIANDFIGTPGRAIVTISATDRYFVSDPECGTWSSVTSGPAQTWAGDGTHQVGVHLKPGLYMTTGPADGCYWEVLSGFGGTLNEIIDNDFTYDDVNVVRIYASDRGFRTLRCGTWYRVG